MTENIASLRNEFLQASLDGQSIDQNPVKQFEMWFEEALNTKTIEPNAFILGTAGKSGQPSQRTLLLKDFDESGFVFYTNYSSLKGIQMSENPRASLLFPWLHLQRQVIITGKVEKTSREDSEAYFHSRPIGSQLGAYISNQSEKIPSRQVLEQKLKEATSQFADNEIPLPDNWGGYRVIPSSFEFWQGRANRLHDRLFYERSSDRWVISRLSP